MCDLNGPFRLCSCNNEVDLEKPHWILKRNALNIGTKEILIIGIMFPDSLIEKIQKRKILRRLNTINVFDFEYKPGENDQLELFSGENYYKLIFKKSKWVYEREWEMLNIIHDKIEKGILESEKSKLKEIYEKYLLVIDNDEIDFNSPNFGKSKFSFSEKKLIEFMQERVKRQKKK